MKVLPGVGVQVSSEGFGGFGRSWGSRNPSRELQEVFQAVLGRDGGGKNPGRFRELQRGLWRRLGGLRGPWGTLGSPETPWVFRRGAEGPGGRGAQELVETLRDSMGAPRGPESCSGEARGPLETFSENR